jgi:hypothetical protein
MPTPREAHTCAILNKVLVVAGGTSDYDYVSSVDGFNLT